MATVIDSLVITLGLDPKNFTQGQKAAAAQLLQFRNQAQQSSKQIEDSTRRAVQFFSSLRTQALGFFSVILGASGLEEMARRIVTSSSAIDKLSHRFDVSAEFASKFGNVIKQVGGSVEEAQGFIAQLGDAIAQANIGLRTEFFTKLQNLGGYLGTSLVGTKGGKFDIEQTITNLGNVFSRLNKEQQNLLAGQLGITPGIFEAMRRPGFGGRVAAAPGIDKELADASQKLVDAFNMLQNRTMVLAAKGLEPLMPLLTKLFDLLDSLANNFEKTTMEVKAFLDMLVGNKPGEEPKPWEWSTEFWKKLGFPNGLRLFGAEKEGATPTEKGNYEKGVDILKKLMPPAKAATPGPGAALGDVPIGLAAVASSVEGINRITSTTGGQHAGEAHAAGLAMDFTLTDPRRYAAVAAALRKAYEKEGLKVIDASQRPDSPFWTGPHIHVEFANKAAAERFQASHHTTNNSSETHIGEINVHAPTGDAEDITRSLHQQLKRNSYSINSDRAYE